MTLIPFIDLAKLVDDAGFPGGNPQAIGIAIICAESGRDPNAKFVNTDGSIDRGLWELNNVWHSEVTDAQAYDPVQATAAAFRISNGGTDYTQWATFNNGAYQAHMEAARVALDGWSRIKKLNAQIASLNTQLASVQSQLTSAQSQLSAITADEQSDEAKIVNLQSQLDSANSALATANSQLASVTTDRDNLRHAVDTAISSLQPVA